MEKWQPLQAEVRFENPNGLCIEMMRFLRQRISDIHWTFRIRKALKRTHKMPAVYRQRDAIDKRTGIAAEQQ